MGQQSPMIETSGEKMCLIFAKLLTSTVFPSRKFVMQIFIAEKFLPFENFTCPKFLLITGYGAN